jgi:hypothetical protein
MLASILDYPRKDLDEQIWDLSGAEPRLHPEIRDQILDVVFSFESDFDIPEDALRDVFIYGSMLTNQYNDETDVDGRILLDKKIIEKAMPGVTGDDLFDMAIETIHGIPLGDTKHPLNLTVVIEGEMGELGQTEFDPVYDVIGDRFVNEPSFADEDFDPEEIFSEDKEQVREIMDNLDQLIQETKVDVIDYSVIQEAVDQSADPELLSQKLESKLSEIEEDIDKLVDEYDLIVSERELAFKQDPEEAWRQSRHWAPGNVQKKYLERYQYSQLLKELKRLLKDGISEQEVDKVEQIVT